MPDTHSDSGLGWPEDRAAVVSRETGGVERPREAGRVVPVGWPSSPAYDGESVTTFASDGDRSRSGSSDGSPEADGDAVVEGTEKLAAGESDGGNASETTGPAAMWSDRGTPWQAKVNKETVTTEEQRAGAFVRRQEPRETVEVPRGDRWETAGATMSEGEERPEELVDADASGTGEPSGRHAAPRPESAPVRGAPLPRPPRTRVMVVANQKGGVGKTTTAVNVAAGLAHYGLRVLVIDLDPQGNASTALGVDHREEIAGVYEVLVDGHPLGDVVSEVPGFAGLDCVPATIQLAGAEIELVSLVARESRLKRALDVFLEEQEGTGERYDYVLIDCPPSLGLLTLNALVAGRELLIPIQCEYYALEGVTQLLRTVELVRSHLNPAVTVSTVVLTMYDGRTRLAAGVAEDVRANFKDAVLKTAIPRSVRISEAPSFGQTVITHDPTSSGAMTYLEAARELALHGSEAPRPDAGEPAPDGGGSPVGSTTDGAAWADDAVSRETSRESQ